MRNPEIELWSLNEVIFQLHGSTCKMWVAPEDLAPVVFHDPVKKSVGYYGAVRLSDGKLPVHHRKVFN